MRILALAAGKGTRLKPYTYTMNKCMIPIAGKPLLYHNLLQCQQAISNITEIIIVVGYRREQIESYFGDKFMGIPVRYIFQQNLDGIAGAVALAKPNLVEQPFLLTLGDMLLIKPRIKDMVDNFVNSHPDGFCGVVTDKPLDEMQDNYTIHLNEFGSIDCIIDKPKKPFNNYMGTGYFLFSPKTLEYVSQTPLSPTSNQRGICEWIMICIKAGLKFYPSIIGNDAININDYQRLKYVQAKIKEGELK